MWASNKEKSKKELMGQVFYARKTVCGLGLYEGRCLVAYRVIRTTTLTRKCTVSVKSLLKLVGVLPLSLMGPRCHPTNWTLSATKF